MRRLRQLNFIFITASFMCSMLLFTQLAHAETKKTTLYYDLGDKHGWVPFRTGVLEGDGGVFADLVILLQSYSTIDFESVHLPMKRAEQALVNGTVDFDFICREWLKNGDIGDDFVASIPLFEINEYVVTLKQNRELYPTLDAIYGENIGTIGGYFYFDDDKFTRVDFLDENKLMKGLKHGRYKGIILDIETAKHWAKVNDVDIAFAALHTKGNLVLRLNKKHSELMDQINTIIARVKKSGELKMILDKYDVENEL